MQDVVLVDNTLATGDTRQGDALTFGDGRGSLISRSLQIAEEMTTVENGLLNVCATIDGREIVRAVIIEDVSQHIDIHRLRVLSKTTVLEGDAIGSTLILVQTLQLGFGSKGKTSHHLRGVTASEHPNLKVIDLGLLLSGQYLATGDSGPIRGIDIDIKLGLFFRIVAATDDGHQQHRQQEQRSQPESSISLFSLHLFDVSHRARFRSA